MKVADKNEFLQVLDEHGNSLNKLELRSVVHKKYYGIMKSLVFV